jgi:ATP-dependent DNA helicase RecG
MPRYTFEDPFLILTIYLNADSAVSTLAPEILHDLGPEEKNGWSFIASKGNISKREYQQHQNLSERTAERHLKTFVDKGLLLKMGKGPASSYVIKR